MPANNTGWKVKELAARHPGRLAHLLSPDGFRRPWLGYAIDNGMYSVFKNGTPFDPDLFLRHVALCLLYVRPRWVAVPDVVGQRQPTLDLWPEWAARLRAEFGAGLPLAFVAQDGMTPADVPADAAVAFLGGSTEWKLDAVGPWCRALPRVHVGRVNTGRRLWLCHDAGAESCDGTGYFRGDPVQLAELEHYLAGRRIIGAAAVAAARN